MNKFYSYAFCLCLIFSCRSGLSASSTLYADCFESAFAAIQIDRLDEMKACLVVFAYDENMEASKELAYPDDVSRWHRSVAILRLFYIDLINGELEKARTLLKKAVESEKMSARSYHFEMNDSELKVVLLEKWLLWESNCKSEVDLGLVGAFYLEELESQKSIAGLRKEDPKGK